MIDQEEQDWRILKKAEDEFCKKWRDGECWVDDEGNLYINEKSDDLSRYFDKITERYKRKDGTFPKPEHQQMEENRESIDQLLESHHPKIKLKTILEDMAGIEDYSMREEIMEDKRNKQLKNFVETLVSGFGNDVFNNSYSEIDKATLDTQVSKKAARDYLVFVVYCWGYYGRYVEPEKILSILES